MFAPQCFAFDTLVRMSVTVQRSIDYMHVCHSLHGNEADQAVKWLDTPKYSSS